MASWRDDASADTQTDLDALLNLALGFAQRQLAERGGFYPYAAAIDGDGQPQTIAPRPAGDTEHPDANDVVSACFGALTDMRDTIRAGAVVTDVRLEDGRDAIRVELEHVDGQALAVLLPYVKTGRDETIEFGQLLAQRGQRQIWA